MFYILLLTQPCEEVVPFIRYWVNSEGVLQGDLMKEVAGGVPLRHGPVWQLRTHVAVVDFSVTPLPSCPSIGRAPLEG